MHVVEEMGGTEHPFVEPDLSGWYRELESVFEEHVVDVHHLTVGLFAMVVAQGRRREAAAALVAEYEAVHGAITDEEMDALSDDTTTS